MFIGLAPQCTIIGVLFGVEVESGIVISLTTFDCILTDLRVINFLVCAQMGFVIWVFI